MTTTEDIIRCPQSLRTRREERRVQKREAVHKRHSNEVPRLCGQRIRSGLVLIDKPEGITSHAVVSYFKKTLEIKKIGHLGTLDPFASGLLPIMIGGATRLCDEILSSQKHYLFTIQLGVETDTLDCCGIATKHASVPQNLEEKLTLVLPDFIGDIEQVPPVYSALKMQGRPLYEHMRATGTLPVDIETKKRIVRIDTIHVVSVDLELARVTVRVRCGKGTYVRSLARDLAKAIGTVGHCHSLRREFIEPWHVDTALGFQKEHRPSYEEIQKHVWIPEKILPDVPKLVLSEKHTRALLSGNVCFVDSHEIDASLLTKFPCNVFIASQSDEVMYYGTAASVLDGCVKICPRKKI